MIVRFHITLTPTTAMLANITVWSRNPHGARGHKPHQSASERRHFRDIAPVRTTSGCS